MNGVVSLLSKSCEYSLRAVLYIASRDGVRYVPIRTIADTLGISFHFLTKLMQKLTARGLLKSYRGPNGGIALARPAGKIRLHDIMVAVGDRDLFKNCVMGLKGCGERKPCPLHKQWAVERVRLERMFRSANVEEAAALVARGKLRLSD